MKRSIAAAVFAAAISVAGAASADTVLSYTEPSNSSVVVAARFPTRGQVITVPADATALRSFTFWGRGPASAVVRTFSNGQIGPVRYASPTSTVATSTVAASAGERTTTLNTPLPVTPGEQIFIGLQYVGPENAYIQAHLTDVEPNSMLADIEPDGRTTIRSYDSRFIATFASLPPPAPVPTMSEWAIILLGTILAGGAALYIHRRRQPV